MVASSQDGPSQRQQGRSPTMPGPLLGVMCSYLCHVSSGPTGQPCSACGDGAPGAGHHTGSVDAGEGREDVSATVVLGVVRQQSPLGSPLRVPSMLVGPQPSISAWHLGPSTCPISVQDMLAVFMPTMGAPDHARGCPGGHSAVAQLCNGPTQLRRRGLAPGVDYGVHTGCCPGEAARTVLIPTALCQVLRSDSICPLTLFFLGIVLAILGL